mmetsp:Transcript_21304/g.61994  ORF Transcript_21304/g.61994 Transcript_21304/m.61994 type:complete len:202 (-) Transcript_21304:589-1194(-)
MLSSVTFRMVSPGTAPSGFRMYAGSTMRPFQTSPDTPGRYDTHFVAYFIVWHTRALKSTGPLSLTISKSLSSPRRTSAEPSGLWYTLPYQPLQSSATVAPPHTSPPLSPSPHPRIALLAGCWGSMGGSIGCDAASSSPSCMPRPGSGALRVCWPVARPRSRTSARVRWGFGGELFCHGDGEGFLFGEHVYSHCGGTANLTQ